LPIIRTGYDHAIYRVTTIGHRCKKSKFITAHSLSPVERKNKGLGELSHTEVIRKPSEQTKRLRQIMTLPALRAKLAPHFGE
jgi:hypothetical protein